MVGTDVSITTAIPMDPNKYDGFVRKYEKKQNKRKVIIRMTSKHPNGFGFTEISPYSILSKKITYMQNAIQTCILISLLSQSLSSSREMCSQR